MSIPSGAYGLWSEDWQTMLERTLLLLSLYLIVMVASVWLYFETTGEGAHSHDAEAK
jgi:hypothetical protein